MALRTEPAGERTGQQARQDDAERASGAVIDVRGLRMRYGSVDVLRGVDLTARRPG